MADSATPWTVCVCVARPWQTLQCRGLCMCVLLGHGRLCNTVDCVCVCVSLGHGRLCNAVDSVCVCV